MTVLCTRWRFDNCIFLKNYEKFVKLCLQLNCRTFLYICQLISAICLHLLADFSYWFTFVSCLFTKSAVCLQFQIFVYNFRYLFTISAVCLQFQLFVYNFSYLSTFVSCLLTFLLTDFQLFVYNLNFRAFEFFHFDEIFHKIIQKSIWHHLAGIWGTI